MAVKQQVFGSASLTDAMSEVLVDFITSQGKVVRPAELVAAAQPKNSPLHGLFEWNDNAAADKYRLWQARYFIGRVEVAIEINGKTERTRLYHSVSIETPEGEGADRAYVDMLTVRADRRMGDEVIQRALAQLEVWRKKHAQYAAIFGEVFRAADRVLRNRKRGKGKRKLEKV